MAMRPRYRTGYQPRQPKRTTYESFKPKSEMSFNDDGTILLVYLPGFVKEQVKVMFTYVDNITLSVKVEGQRPLSGGKWSRFSELYRIPETCDIDKIDSEFQHGVLTIIMPNIKIDEAQKGSEAEATQEISSPQEIAETSALLGRQREEKEKYIEPVSPNMQATTSEEKSVKARDETSQKTASLIDTAMVGSGGESANEKVDKKPQMGQQVEETEKYVEVLSPNNKVTTSEEKSQKVQEETSQKTVSLINTARVGSGNEIAYEKVDEKSQMGHQIEASPKNTTLVDMAEQIDREKRSVGLDGASSNRKADEKEKPGEVEKPEGEAVAQKDEEKQKSDKSKEDDVIAEKSKDAKQEITCASEGLIEGKQLLLNMGTAVLVILGLGAYSRYTVGSFGKA